MTPILRTLSDVAPQPICWLWRNYVPIGKLTIVEGDPGQGKSLVLADLVARVTTNALMPDGSASDLPGPANVLLLVAEDDIADTIRPRMEAAGADLSRVFLLETIATDEATRLPLIPEDLAQMANVVTDIGAKLIVIDPVSAYLSPRVDAWKDTELRRALTPLAILAADLGIALIVIRHWTKSPTLNPLHKGGGSIAFSAAARTILAVVQHPEDDQVRVVTCIKSNLSARPPALAFAIEQAGTAPVVRWRGPIDLAATDLTSGGRNLSPERAAVLAYVKAVGRPVSAKELVENLGLNDSTARWHLSTAAKAGQLVRTATGLYQYPTTSSTNSSNSTNNANNLESVHINGVGDVGVVGKDGSHCYRCGGALKASLDRPGWLQCQACGWWSRMDDPAYARGT
jgi:DNA-binding transcriptional ArsR family regulator